MRGKGREGGRETGKIQESCFYLHRIINNKKINNNKIILIEMAKIY